MSNPTLGSLLPFERAYVCGLLQLPKPSVLSMAAQGLLPHSPSYTLRQFSQPHLAVSTRFSPRISAIPNGKVYLSFDFMLQKRSSQCIEGVDQYYSNGHKRILRGHQYASSAFLNPYAAHDPLPFQLELHISKVLEYSEQTPTQSQPRDGIYYPYLKPIDRLIDHIKQAREAGVACIGVVADAEFTTKDNLNLCRAANISVIGRIKKSIVMNYGGERRQIRHMTELFPFKSCSHYKTVGWRARSSLVSIEGLDQTLVKIVLVWRKNRGEWIPFFLISTHIQTTTGEIIRAWQKRWQIEVLHRLYKQNFGLSSSQFIHYASQQHHANLVLEAYGLARVERDREWGLGWREARRRAGEKLRKQLVTEGFARAA